MATPTPSSMNPLVRDLIKRCVLLKHNHYDPKYFWSAVRREFNPNTGISSEKDIMKAVAYGRWMVREEQGRVRFKQYRMLQQRYNPEFDHHPHSQFPENQGQFAPKQASTMAGSSTSSLEGGGIDKQRFGLNNPFGKRYDEVAEVRKLERGEE